MPEILVTYDINKDHINFKKRLKNLGYSDQLEGSNLPNTTMYHVNKTVKDSRAEIKLLCHNMKIYLERLMIVEISDWAGIKGEEHSD